MKVSQLCQAVGMTRQNYYKVRKFRQRKAVDESLILDLVRAERSVQKRLGCNKALFRIRPQLELEGVEIGRDRFFKLMSEHDLLIKHKKRTCSTTNSRHGFMTYINLLKDSELTGPNQAWVSDITYLRTREGFVYLALVMDAWSRAIIGYDCSDSLEAVGALRALKMARKQQPSGANTIHHSDRGCQYCCKAYIAELEGMQISMTEENHCYENAKAERLNGIVKQEYGLGDTFTLKSDAYEAVAEAVYLYNHLRPHLSLGYKYPIEVHNAA